jgi:hypothetical protein
MERSSFVALPADRCGYSEPPNTCFAEAWHEGSHAMVPRSWIVNCRGGL